jgi:hypothetical protein
MSQLPSPVSNTAVLTRWPSSSSVLRSCGACACIVAGASREFADLITRLLDKNPATRISWRVCGDTGMPVGEYACSHT